ncbi:MAG: OB-fold domain-containing protein, partial [Myxococcales bacterium]
RRAMSTETIESAEGLFADTKNGPRLLGSRCVTCDTPYFPRSAGCHNPNCDLSKMEDAEFGPKGKIWSLSIQNYPPPPPVVIIDPFEPFAVGMVDLVEGLRVLGRIVSDTPDKVDVGDEVELVLAPLGVDATGAEVISWQFRPI